MRKKVSKYTHDWLAFSGFTYLTAIECTATFCAVVTGYRLQKHSFMHTCHIQGRNIQEKKNK